MKNYHPIGPDDGYDPEHETNLRWHATEPRLPARLLPRTGAAQVAGRVLGALLLLAVGGLTISLAIAGITAIWKWILA